MNDVGTEFKKYRDKLFPNPDAEVASSSTDAPSTAAGEAAADPAM
jgi:hypothetical protein